jgi:hypothetical protein
VYSDLVTQVSIVRKVHVPSTSESDPENKTS